MSKEYILLTFENMTKALICEEFLLEFNARTIPTPSFITHSCGLSIKIDISHKQNILDLIEKNKFEYEKAFLIHDNKIKNLTK